MFVYQYFKGTRETDLMRFPSIKMITEWMTAAGFKNIRTAVAERIQDQMIGKTVLHSPFLKKHNTSQLAILSDDAYRVGLNRIKNDIQNAEATNSEIKLKITQNSELKTLDFLRSRLLNITFRSNTRTGFTELITDFLIYIFKECVHE
jgi:hypothetical protein